LMLKAALTLSWRIPATYPWLMCRLGTWCLLWKTLTQWTNWTFTTWESVSYKTSRSQWHLNRTSRAIEHLMRLNRIISPSGNPLGYTLSFIKRMLQFVFLRSSTTYWISVR
jgi:hypothetical protein